MRRPWKSKAQQSSTREPKMQVERTKTTTISSETHEVFIVTRTTQGTIRTWCNECAAEVDMLRPEEAAAIAKVSTRTVYRWIEDSQIHHTESDGGNVVVCSKELFRNRYPLEQNKLITE